MTEQGPGNVYSLEEYRARLDDAATNYAQLGTVFTIPQVAKMAGWTTTRMRRHLTSKNNELDGALLRDVSRGRVRPRWTITLAALQAIAPQWFIDPESTQRQVEGLQSEIQDLRLLLFHLTKRLDQQVEHIVELKQRCR